MIDIPAAFATGTIVREGEAGRAWLAALPTLVQALCDEWRLMLDGAPMHGYLGIVVPVRQGDERQVLKVSWIEASNRDDAAALTAWGGRAKRGR